MQKVTRKEFMDKYTFDIDEFNVVVEKVDTKKVNDEGNLFTVTIRLDERGEDHTNQVYFLARTSTRIEDLKLDNVDMNNQEQVEMEVHEYIDYDNIDNLNWQDIADEDL